jgi:hypothetical protein
MGNRGLGNGGGLRSRSHPNVGNFGGKLGIGNAGSGIRGFGSLKLQLTCRRFGRPASAQRLVRQVTPSAAPASNRAPEASPGALGSR